MPGETREFGPYRLLRRLGVGGMAETFEATRAGTGGFEQRVCLKRVLPAYIHDPTFVDRFKREARLAARLRHSNIVGVTDFGEVDGVGYMVLELVDGVDLRSLLKSSPNEKLPPAMVALIGLDLAYALEHAHESIIHRDLSPANVLISRTGETKLADFGIARAIAAGATVTKSVQGKIPYMSPEQIRGEAVDARSDLFSLGVVLFEAATGVRPFDGVHDVDTMQRIVEGQRRGFEEAGPSVPVALQTVIENLIAIDPECRTPSASQLVAELASLSPPPQIRRELASMVEAQRGGPSTRMHVRAREDDPDTELDRAAELRKATDLDEGSAASAKTRDTRTFFAAIAILALIAGIVLVGSLDWRGASENVGSSSGPPGPVAAPEQTEPQEIVAEEPIDTRAENALDAEEDAAANAQGISRGWLHVVVQPWGNVWIDGDWMGRAPVKARVSRGRHVVEVGRELPSEKRVVKVEAGTRKEIEINLAE